MSAIHFPGITFNEADGQILLVSQPVQGRAAMDAATLHQLLVQEGYGDCRLDAEAIASAAEMCNVQQEPFGIQLAQRLDAEYQVHTSSDGMTATLSIIPPVGGKPAAPEQALQALTLAGVVFGIDQTAVSQACQKGSCSHVIVARGIHAQDGADAVFEDLVPHTVNREPTLDENGLIDYRERGAIETVQPGDALMRRTPATAGIDGHSVKGGVVKAQPGKDRHFAAGLSGAEVSSDDPCVLVAAVSGQPVRVDCGVTVEPVVRFKEVNMATGNIHFDGNVHVTGEVVQGMKVVASGDIVVDGMVDSGLLEAGGNIQVAGGVIVRSALRACGSVRVRFAEGVKIHAGTVIAIKDMALECELDSLNQIIVGAGSRQKGRLIGGVATATMLVRVSTLGSDKAGATKVVLGVNRALEEQYAALLKRIDEEKAQETRLEQLIKQLKVADPKGILERARASWQQAVLVWGKSLKEREALEKELEATRAARLEVAVGTAGAVELSLCKLTARLRREFDRGVFALDAGGDLVFTGTDGTPQLLARLA